MPQDQEYLVSCVEQSLKSCLQKTKSRFCLSCKQNQWSSQEWTDGQSLRWTGLASVNFEFSEESISCIYFFWVRTHFGEQIYHCFFLTKRKHRIYKISLSYILDNTTSCIHWYYNFQGYLNKMVSVYCCQLQTLHPQQTWTTNPDCMAEVKQALISSPCIYRNHRFSLNFVDLCLHLQLTHNSFYWDMRKGPPGPHRNFYKGPVALSSHEGSLPCPSHSVWGKTPDRGPHDSSGTAGPLLSPVNNISNVFQFDFICVQSTCNATTVERWFCIEISTNLIKYDYMSLAYNKKILYSIFVKRIQHA